MPAQPALDIPYDQSIMPAQSEEALASLETPLKHVLDSLENVLGALGAAASPPPAAAPFPPPPPPLFWDEIKCDAECIGTQIVCTLGAIIIFASMMNTRRLLYYNYGMCSTLMTIQGCLLAYMLTLNLLSLVPHSVVIITSIQHVIRAVFVYTFTSLSLSMFTGVVGGGGEEQTEAIATTFANAGVTEQEFHFPLILCWGISYKPDRAFLTRAISRVNFYVIAAGVMVLWKAVANDYGLMRRQRPYIGMFNLVAIVIAVSGKLAIDQLMSKLILPSARRNIELRNLVYLYFVVIIGGNGAGELSPHSRGSSSNTPLMRAPAARVCPCLQACTTPLRSSSTRLATRGSATTRRASSRARCS